MSSLSNPLNLREHITAPRLGMDAIPFLDVLLIGLCLMLMGSTFVAAPGVTVDIPKSARTEALPIAGVLTLKHDNMLLYEGRIFSLAEFAHYFERDMAGRMDGERGVLLVKLNRNVSMQTFLEVCDIARQAGFARVHIATSQQTEDRQPWTVRP